ncbi:DUF349 domain-containing protein [Microlunatus flavus]|uniref:DUF349 domain-containing protein n=1 Tax=Microlunatus flavus TaxID=1036181 RepID=A0A1H9FD44_9ACTN|nr:DUF349 domain-containing protein [Microlunatus flavus]SEQ35856.1 protein of unknown function [Microlunatus flavus]
MTDGDAPAAWGRVEADGTVYVRTADGERAVGQVPDVPESEALAFFTRRFDALELEVSLLERRVRSGALSADDAAGSIKTVRKAVTDANAVGDLDGLLTRLQGLQPVVDEARAAARAERSRQQEEVRAAKEKAVVEAETLATGNDWRGGVNRFRALLDDWKALPRLDRATDDALWHRFSTARTTYTRRRKQQFAQQNEQRDTARVAKEQLVAEAEALAGSTDWGPTTGAYRDLMTRWKAAGSAPRGVDEALWRRFRAAQDTFFANKQTVNAAQDAEFQVNADAKVALLDEAEASILPVTDLGKARVAYRELLERWSAIGKVPRDSMRPLDARLRAIENAVNEAEEHRWRRTNPEARARAEDTAAKLEAQIANLEEQAAKADAGGDAKKAQQARDSAATYREWLAQAQQAASDFSG